MTLKKATLIDIINNYFAEYVNTETDVTEVLDIACREYEELGQTMIDITAVLGMTMLFGLKAIEQKTEGCFIYCVDTHELMDEDYNILAC